MRIWAGLFAITILGAWAPSLAATEPTGIGNCAITSVNFDPSQIVAACTMMIESWHGTDQSGKQLFHIRGRAFYRAGVSDRAIQDYIQAVTLDPNFAEAFNDLGEAYFQKGEYQQGLKSFDEAIRVKPDYAEAYNNRGNVYYQKGEVDRALVEFDKAVNLDPTQPIYAFNRALTYITKGDCLHAMADFDRAKNLNEQLAAPDDLLASCPGSP